MATDQSLASVEPKNRPPFEAWAPLEGMWEFGSSRATYIGPLDQHTSSPNGLALGPVAFRSGTIRTTVNMGQKSSGRVIFGYNTATKGYYSIGLAGHGFAYVLVEYHPGYGWRLIRGEGSDKNLDPARSYDLLVRVSGQRVSLVVDGVKILDSFLPSPPVGDQIGIFAWGSGPVVFQGFEPTTSKPRAFVVMQYGDPYDSLYGEVIKPIAREMGLEARRADDLNKPGIILKDIKQEIEESEVVIVEISPVNANVYYELGYAHAREKATILLALHDRTKPLPFDISGYRCIFYEDTIKGKKDIETNLRQYLRTITNGG